VRNSQSNRLESVEGAWGVTELGKGTLRTKRRGEKDGDCLVNGAEYAPVRIQLREQGAGEGAQGRISKGGGKRVCFESE